MTNEPDEHRMRFLEIDNIEPKNPEPDKNAKHPARVAKVSDIIKKGQEFATTKPEHDDEMNPVEFDDKGSSDRQKGLGKASDGAKPKGKVKESDDIEAKAKSLISEWVRHAKIIGVDPRDKNAYREWVKSQAQEESLSEGAHKEGCQCGFCRNKGKIGDWAKRTKGVSKMAPGDDSEMAGAESEEESLQSPQEIVAALLEKKKGNVGTPPGIMGHKSYNTLKLPKEYPDRKFAPAKGMVQPDSAIVKKQTRRKVNKGK
jgi:hypothetical protein